jgi:hypothetical protein
MNLVQIQERLKDLPTQAIMGYANGQNPQVPPYLALGELNRRKQMEQQAAQPPQGTVKDNIEQQVGLMQLQKARQGQMAQQSAMQGANAPMIPRGTPEPDMQPEAEMAMAAGGLTSLPIQEMNFGSGGIVAFSQGDLVEEAKAAAKAAKDKLYTFGLRQRQQDPEGYAIAQAEAAIAEENIAKARRANPELGPAGAMGRSMIQPIAPPAAPVAAQPVPAPAAPPAPPANPLTSGIVTALPPKPAQVRPPIPAAVAPAAPPAATPASPAATPAAPAPPEKSAAQLFQENLLAGKDMPALPAEYAPPKQAPIAEEYLKYLSERAGKRTQDEARNKEVESARARRDFFNSLIAGGEATRGQRGIGALFAGAGRSLGTSMSEAEDRAAAYQEKQQLLADNEAKTRFEIANLQRAEERGDAKAIYDSKTKLYDLKQEQMKIRGQAATEIAKREFDEKSDLRKIAADRDLAALRFDYDRKLRGMPQAQRATLEEQYVNARVKAGASLADAIREVKTLGVGAKGQLTYDQASDNVDKFLTSTQGMAYLAQIRTEAKQQNKPLPDQFTIRNQLIRRAMEDAGPSQAPRANNDLLKAADAIIGGVK